jgi:hypothetical protein
VTHCLAQFLLADVVECDVCVGARNHASMIGSRGLSVIPRGDELGRPPGHPRGRPGPAPAGRAVACQVWRTGARCSRARRRRTRPAGTACAMRSSGSGSASGRWAAFRAASASRVRVSATWVCGLIMAFPPWGRRSAWAPNGLDNSDNPDPHCPRHRPSERTRIRSSHPLE